MLCLDLEIDHAEARTEEIMQKSTEHAGYFAECGRTEPSNVVPAGAHDVEERWSEDDDVLTSHTLL